MKTSHLAAAVGSRHRHVHPRVNTRSHAATSTIPVHAGRGVMSAFPTVVQTGTKPTLTWNILYPSKVSDVAPINPPGTITITQKNTYVSVQPIGTGVTVLRSAPRDHTTLTPRRG